MVERIATRKSVEARAEGLLNSFPKDAFEALEETEREELYSGLGESFRARVTADLQKPYEAVRHYLDRIADSGKTPPAEGSSEWNENLALRRLIVQYGHYTLGLQVVAQGNLSCSKHGAIYAGGVESKGNEIYTPEAIAANALEDALSLAMPPTLPDGSSSSEDLSDPVVLDGELQKLIEGLDAMKDVDFSGEEAVLVISFLKDELTEKVLKSTDPAEYISSRISSRYEFDGQKRSSSIPRGSKDDAAFFLAHQTQMARSYLRTIAAGELPCVHEERYAGGVQSQGNKLFTTQEFAASGLKMILDQKHKPFKL